MARGRRERSGTDSKDCCPVCARPLEQPAGSGRRRRYCSHACRQVAYRRRRDGERRRGLVRLLEGDARLLLARLPSESVDLIVTDPPYVFDHGGNLFVNWFAQELPDEVWPEVFAELYRVLRPDRHAYIFADRRVHPVFDVAAKSAGFRVHHPLVWDKDWLGPGGGAWRSCYELICFYEKGRRKGNSRSLGNVLRAPRPHRGYPTEKPVAALQTLIGQASEPGELVLDPFCGSGNVGLAARELQRRALLCDVTPSVAARRLRLAPVPLEVTAA